MSQKALTAIRREDYQPPTHWFDQVALHFELFEDKTIVRSKIRFRVNESRRSNTLELNGEELELVEVRIDDRTLK